MNSKLLFVKDSFGLGGGVFDKQKCDIFFYCFRSKKRCASDETSVDGKKPRLSNESIDVKHSSFF